MVLRYVKELLFLFLNNIIDTNYSTVIYIYIRMFLLKCKKKNTVSFILATSSFVSLIRDNILSSAISYSPLKLFVSQSPV